MEIHNLYKESNKILLFPKKVNKSKVKLVKIVFHCNDGLVLMEFRNPRKKKLNQIDVTLSHPYTDTPEKIHRIYQQVVKI